VHTTRWSINHRKLAFLFAENLKQMLGEQKYAKWDCQLKRFLL